jgi:hypothetical protein
MSPSHEILRCSFCNKDQNDVAKMIAGPDVCICNECVAVCVKILRGDELPSTEGLFESFDATSLHTAVDEKVTCVVCGKVARAGDALALPGHGFLCRRCTEVVEASLELRRES